VQNGKTKSKIAVVGKQHVAAGYHEPLGAKMNEEQRQSFFAEFEELGETKVQHFVNSSTWKSSNSYKQSAAHEWLLIKSAERNSRAEEREEESLSISRKALFISKRATWIATSAIILSIIMAIKEIIDWYSSS
jgi:hypothetical protein